jgi:hypothetical protein
MLKFNINWWAVLAAGFASWLIGGIWYGGVFVKKWIELNAFNEQQRQTATRGLVPNLFIFFASDVLMAAVFALFLAVLPQWTVSDGVLVALAAWLGFQATQTMSYNAAGGKPLTLFFIDASKQLASLLAIGIILGAWK